MKSRSRASVGLPSYEKELYAWDLSAFWNVMQSKHTMNV